MFSSQSNQSSYQDQRLSAFTEALLDACATFEGNDIRYKDIVDRVSDSFSENPEQRPLFVIQANLTEDFCSFEEEQKKTLIQTIEKYKQPHNQGSPTENPPVPGKPGSAANLSLLEIAKAQSADYCTKEEVDAFLAELKQKLQASTLPDHLAGIYQLKTEFNESNYPAYISDRAAIAKWLIDNQDGYFAEPTYSREEYEVEKPDYLGIRTSRITKYRQVLSGYKITAQTQYRDIKFTAIPNFQHLSYIVGVASVLFSKKEIVFFSCVHEAKESDWGELASIEHPKWAYRKMLLKKDLQAARASDFLLKWLIEFIEESARKRLGLSPSDDAGKGASSQKK
jgi:hypothetical protein